MSSRAIYTVESPTRENSSVAFPADGKLAESRESACFTSFFRDVENGREAIAKVIPVNVELLRLPRWIINFQN